MKLIKLKKAQDIKMAETIFILLIFIILLMFGLSFLTRYQKTNVAAIKSDQTMKKSVETSQIFAYLPEIACSFDNVRKENCVDLLKVEAAASTIRAHQSFYFPYFKYSKIVIYEIYPEENTWVLYDNSIPKTTKISTPIPIALYDGRDKAYYYGVMEVNYYQPKSLSS